MWGPVKLGIGVNLLRLAYEIDATWRATIAWWAILEQIQLNLKFYL